MWRLNHMQILHENNLSSTKIVSWAITTAIKKTFSRGAIFMFRAGIILLIIIFLQVTTFAASCEWKDISPSFFKSLNTNSTVFHMCKTVRDNTNEKIATIACADNRSYMVFYARESIYMPTTSSSHNHVLTKCWREGSINQSCEANVAPLKCRAWDLDTY